MKHHGCSDFIKLVIVFAIFQCALVSTVSWGAIHYVSPTGTSSWNDSINLDRPCSAKTAMQNARAGDIVYFRGGTYNVGCHPSTYLGALMPSNSGEEGKYIVFKAYKSERVILNGAYDPYSEFCRVLATNNKDYIIFDGFVIQSDGGTRAGSIIVGGEIGSSNCIVQNCIINGGDLPKIKNDNIEGIRIEKGTNILIRNCKIYNFKADDDYLGISGVKSYDGTNVTIENCEIENCMTGIYPKCRNKNWDVRYSWINLCRIGIYATPYSISGVPRNCLNLKIYHNVIANSSYIGIHIYSEDAGRADYAQLYNNTIYETSSSNFEMRNGYEFKVYNNIVAGSWISIKFGTTAYSILECDHNCYYGSSFQILTHLYSGTKTYSSLSQWQSSGELDSGSNPGLGSIFADPKFLNLSGTMSELGDFHLALDSPCKGAGRNGADMGANIDLVGVKTGDSGGSPPPNPSNLRKLSQ